MVKEILVSKREEKEIKGKLSIDASLFFMTSSGETSNFLERVLQLETIDKCEVSMKL